METGTARARLDLDDDERFQRLRQELGVTAFGLNLMRLQPGQRGRVHRHRHQEEVFVVLDGELTIATPGEEHVLGRLDVLRVAPEVRRQMINRGAEPVRFLAVGGAGVHEGRDAIAYTGLDVPEEEGRPPQEVPLPDDLTP